MKRSGWAEDIDTSTVVPHLVFLVRTGIITREQGRCIIAGIFRELRENPGCPLAGSMVGFLGEAVTEPRTANIYTRSILNVIAARDGDFQ
jgi:hypothetical protein